MNGLHPVVLKGLQQQIALENEASCRYLHMATWAEVHHYPGAATFLYNHAEEERGHMLKLMRYLTDLEIAPAMPLYTPKPIGYDQLQQLFADVLQNEQEVSQAIHALVLLTRTHNDIATEEFLQWFVREQREEESIARKALEFFERVDATLLGLYTIDQALASLSETKA